MTQFTQMEFNAIATFFVNQQLFRILYNTHKMTSTGNVFMVLALKCDDN